MRLVLVAVTAALARQLINTQRIVDVVRIRSDRMPMRKVGRRQQQPVMVVLLLLLLLLLEVLVMMGVMRRIVVLLARRRWRRMKRMVMRMMVVMNRVMRMTRSGRTRPRQHVVQSKR